MRNLEIKKNILFVNIVIICSLLSFGMMHSYNKNDSNRDRQKNKYSTIFNGKAYLSEALLDDMGCLVLKFTHALSFHRGTVMKDKILLKNGDVRIVFDTEYRSWSTGHHMIWSIKFNRYAIAKDINFISDTGRFKTGAFYNRIKNNIIKEIRKIMRE